MAIFVVVLIPTSSKGEVDDKDFLGHLGSDCLLHLSDDFELGIGSLRSIEDRSFLGSFRLNTLSSLSCTRSESAMRLINLLISSTRS